MEYKRVAPLMKFAVLCMVLLTLILNTNLKTAAVPSAQKDQGAKRLLSKSRIVRVYFFPFFIDPFGALTPDTIKEPDRRMPKANAKLLNRLQLSLQRTNIKGRFNPGLTRLRVELSNSAIPILVDRDGNVKNGAVQYRLGVRDFERLQDIVAEMSRGGSKTKEKESDFDRLIERTNKENKTRRTTNPF